MKKLVIVIFMVLATLHSYAQQLKEFTLTNVADGKTIALTDYKSGPGIVIIFGLNNCPFDDYYAQRIKSLAQYKIPVLVVNSSTDPAETTEKMAKRASQIGLSMPYLADKDFVLIKQLNARKSTEAFLLKNINGEFKVFYRGSIDDNPQVEADVKHNYLKDAIDKLLSDQPLEFSETRPVGCNIRMN